MVAQGKPSYISPEEYLRRQRDAEMKSEYENGVIIAMAGGTAEHNRIAFDLGVSLANQLRGKPCEPFGSDMRVRVSREKFYYPDFTLVCGEVKFDDKNTLANPTLIVEVLSDSTESRDRVVKFDAYRALPSLMEYVLVAQDRARIECYTRQPDESWRIDIAIGTDAILPLPGIGCELRLAEIYARVSFPPAEEASDSA